MALTSPFINTIPAFDANIGISLSVNILGGDAITGYQFFISPANSQTILYQSGIIPVQNDIANATIRSYPINITTAMGLENNKSYGIYCQTYNVAQPSGQMGQTTLFECYALPNVKLQYLDLTGYKDLVANSTMSGTTQSFQICFDKIDLNSVAEPNIAQLTLFGIDAKGNKNFIYQTSSIYNFEHILGTSLYKTTVELSGFSSNLNSQQEYDPSSKYVNFEIDLSLSTIENTQINQTYSNINCYYSILANSPYMTVYNLCDEGIIRINCSLTSLQGVSNIPINDLVYIDEEELDLRTQTYPAYNEAYVTWQKYFTLQQPYTLRLWGRNFNVGTIFQFTHTLYTGNYIRLEYNNDGTSTYISLYSGQNNDNGDPMYPYYIESARIPTSNIVDTTNLFIGIQQQNGLFNLDFEILT